MKAEKKIKFVDWHENLDTATFLNILSKKFEVVIADDPDFIFYADFGRSHINDDRVRIYYTSENLVPDFNVCDYAIGFHHICFEDRYLRSPIYGLFRYRADYEWAKTKHVFSSADLDSKDRFCNFVYSNPKAHGKRTEIFNFLGRYKKVDSAGKYLNNVGGPVRDKHRFQMRYRFSIAFENSSMSGYTTEKIVQASAARTIPIYWGDPNIDMYFNERAFINCHKYASFHEVLDRVIEIDTNPRLFESMLRELMLASTDIDHEDLEQFLWHILDRGERNYRRSNILRGQWYQNWIKTSVALRQ